METEITLVAPLTSKLLGNSLIPYNRFTTRKTPSFRDFGAVGLRLSVVNMSELPTLRTSHTKFQGNDKEQCVKEKVETKTLKCESKGEKEDEAYQHCSAAIEEHMVKHLNKTTKYAFIFKLKKEEIKQVEKGDTSVLQTLFKSMTGDVSLNADNFRIIPDRHLSAVMENIRQAADVFEVEGLQKAEKELQLSIDKSLVKSPRKANLYQHTQCGGHEGGLDTDDSMKPIKYYLACRKSKNCDQSTQYEQQTEMCGTSEKVLSIDKCIQCKLVTSNGLSNSQRIRKTQLQTATRSTQYEIELCAELKTTKQEEVEPNGSLVVPQDSLVIIRKKFCNKHKQQAERLRAGELHCSYLPDSVTLLPEQKLFTDTARSVENDFVNRNSNEQKTISSESNSLDKSHQKQLKFKLDESDMPANYGNIETELSAADKSRGVVFGGIEVAECPVETLTIDEVTQVVDDTVINIEDKNFEIEYSSNIRAEIIEKNNFIEEFIEEQLKTLQIDPNEGEINFESVKNFLQEVPETSGILIKEKEFQSSKPEINEMEVEEAKAMDPELKNCLKDVKNCTEADELKTEIELTNCHSRLITELMPDNETLNEVKIPNDFELKPQKIVSDLNVVTMIADNEETETTKEKSECQKSSSTKIPTLEQRNSKTKNSSQQLKSEVPKKLSPKVSNIAVNGSKLKLPRSRTQISKVTMSSEAISTEKKAVGEIVEASKTPTINNVELSQEPNTPNSSKAQSVSNQTTAKPSRIPISVRRKSYEAFKLRLQNGKLGTENVVKEGEKTTTEDAELNEWKTQTDASLAAVSESSSWENTDFPARGTRNEILYYEKQRKLIELIVRGVEHEIQAKSSHNFPN